MSNPADTHDRAKALHDQADALGREIAESCARDIDLPYRSTAIDTAPRYSTDQPLVTIKLSDGDRMQVEIRITEQGHTAATVCVPGFGHAATGLTVRAAVRDLIEQSGDHWPFAKPEAQLRDPRIDPQPGDVLSLPADAPVHIFLPGACVCLVVALGTDEAKVVGDQVRFSWMNDRDAVMAYETLTIAGWRAMMAAATVLRVVEDK